MVKRNLLSRDAQEQRVNSFPLRVTLKKTEAIINCIKSNNYFKIIILNYII